ncbi:uncharacterized protein LOC127857627 [Dreissena polymorpha]|uniref:Uncharacterized protein n=1 Tax=Dreissena polymorpha TaxID=45954 RepID=A0A9D3Z4D6_DREPO|nr:uncharacterized protein LOC127857627 [Dreissena polymorpha]KAH3710097.1 hypothetical protein DPMN_069563 [Dreissena polymorpha]
MGKDVLTLCGAVLAALACLFTILSFSTSHWLESFQEARSGFKRLGLWEACFDKYTYDKDTLGKTYDECGWIFSYDYRPIFDWLNPAWFLAVQVMMTLALILSLVTAILCLLGILNFCPDHRVSVAQLTNSILMFITGALLALAVTIFGIKADTDRAWLPRPDQNYMSWSFGLAVVAGFFAIFSGMCLVIDSLRLRIKARKQNAPHAFSDYKMKTVPPQYN